MIEKPWQDSKNVQTVKIENLNEDFHDSTAFDPCDESESSESLLVEDSLRADETESSHFSLHHEETIMISKRKLKAAILTSAVKDKFECKLCRTLYKTKKILKVHMKSVHMRIKRFQCENCDKSFYHKQAMIYHTKQNVCQKPRKTAKKKILVKEEIL